MLLAVLLVICCFGLVTLFGAPYLPTLKKQQKEALDLLNLKSGQVLLELGSGDGRLLLAAAKRGICCVGYEINPILYIVSRLVTYKYRRLVKVHFSDYWSAKWPECQAVYVFSMPRFMPRLNKRIVQLEGKKIKLVSYAACLPGRKEAKKRGALWLYII